MAYNDINAWQNLIVRNLERTAILRQNTAGFFGIHPFSDPGQNF